ncbi:MAG: SDR family oxidoreductase [Oxalobacter sp.]|nr:MAG: SDR family oxidoreductase [Oxalobacter sp.]
MRILVLGASGMLGSAMVRVMSERHDLEIFGTLRSPLPDFERIMKGVHFLHGIYAHEPDSLASALSACRPDVVVNCIGLVKQISTSDGPLDAIPINSILPHRLARFCELSGARLVHISTDCVFSGSRGNYKESDAPDAQDLYGRSKLLGEVDYPHAITIRTSMIGHELRGGHSLVEWFMSQKYSCLGYERAIFSGVPTVVLSRMIRDIILPRRDLHGVYHAAAEPISKFDLLKLIAEKYKKKIKIIPDAKVAIDRSLDGSRLQEETGFIAPSWPELIDVMYSSHRGTHV